ncbi:MAG: zinc-ribbon domain-containing protein [Gemmatimonadetes bacterium]|nr:zinc-ribbon domain-containing protein [Gemmatimonadota bacterium]MBM4191437.1 hypothetical protein [Gemmatimonadota bacterium]
MNVGCGSCGAIYRVDPALVPATGVTARCSACGAAVSLRGTSHGTPIDDGWFSEEQGTAQQSEWSRALAESDAAAAPEIESNVRPSAAVPTPIAVTRPPFLRATPHERAQRLARALVSDLIAYHPGRREAAQAAGTLRIAFREEIAQSYAFYVAEVGREMAEGTSYFQEALNEMVAQGRALF